MSCSIINMDFTSDTIKSIIFHAATLDDEDDIISFRISDCLDEVYDRDKWELIDELHIIAELKGGRQAQIVYRPHVVFIRQARTN